MRQHIVAQVSASNLRLCHGLHHRQEFFQFETREEIQLAAVQSALEAMRERISR